MRRLAYFANFIFAAMVTYWLIYEISHESTAIGIAQVALLIGAFYLLPTINFLALFACGNSRDVFSLYFERKKLEEEKRILELRKSIEKQA